jgi:hypothetical protein
LLDIYHAREHLWAQGKALPPQDEQPARRDWGERHLYRLRHGQEAAVLAEVAALCPAAGEWAGQISRRERKYFAGHAGRMNYQSVARRGWPMGGGAVGSGCRTRQCRRKRPGQFGTPAG